MVSLSLNLGITATSFCLKPGSCSISLKVIPDLILCLFWGFFYAGSMLWPNASVYRMKLKILAYSGSCLALVEI